MEIQLPLEHPSYGSRAVLPQASQGPCLPRDGPPSAAHSPRSRPCTSMGLAPQIYFRGGSFLLQRGGAVDSDWRQRWWGCASERLGSACEEAEVPLGKWSLGRGGQGPLQPFCCPRRVAWPE